MTRPAATTETRSRVALSPTARSRPYSAPIPANGEEAVDNFWKADRAYQRALQEAEALKRVRDDSILALEATGLTVRDIAARTKLSPGGVQQIIERARQAAPPE